MVSCRNALSTSDKASPSAVFALEHAKQDFDAVARGHAGVYADAVERRVSADHGRPTTPINLRRDDERAVL